MCPFFQPRWRNVMRFKKQSFTLRLIAKTIDTFIFVMFCRRRNAVHSSCSVSAKFSRSSRTFYFFLVSNFVRNPRRYAVTERVVNNDKLVHVSGIATLAGQVVTVGWLCRVLSLSDCRYSLNPLSQTRID